MGSKTYNKILELLLAFLRERVFGSDNIIIDEDVVEGGNGGRRGRRERGRRVKGELVMLVCLDLCLGSCLPPSTKGNNKCWRLGFVVKGKIPR